MTQNDGTKTVILFIWEALPETHSMRLYKHWVRGIVYNYRHRERVAWRSSATLQSSSGNSSLSLLAKTPNNRLIAKPNHMVYILTQAHTLQIPLFCKEGLGEICTTKISPRMFYHQQIPLNPPLQKGEARLSKISAVIL